MQSVAEVTALLASNPVFARCSERTFSWFIERSQMMCLESRAAVFDEGSPANSVFVLLAGTVRVFHPHEDGREITVKHLSAPCTFGEMEILSGETHFLESVSAMTDTTLLRIPPDVFLRLIDEEPVVASVLLSDVCARFCVAARNELSLFQEVPRRVAALVLSYADLFGVDHPKGRRVAKSLTRQEIANGLGVTIRSVTRVLTEWQRLGWVSRSKGWLIIHSTGALEKLAGEGRFALNYHFKERPRR